MATMVTQPDSVSALHMLVVDDHDLVRLGLRTLVQAHATEHGRAMPVLEARTLQEALAVYRLHEQHIGLVLLDLHLPDAHGLSGLTAFLTQFPRARLVVLSGDNDPALRRQALDHGAQAYLAKSGDLQQVIDYIQTMGLLGPPVQAVPAPPAPATTVYRACGQTLRLTERQVQVLEWMLAGRSNREIAEQAHLSEGTVKNHVSTLLLLFGVRSRAQLISLLR